MPMVINGDVYYTSEEATKHAGVTYQTLYRWAKNRLIKKYKVGKGNKVFFKKTEIDMVLALHALEDSTEE